MRVRTFLLMLLAIVLGVVAARSPSAFAAPGASATPQASGSTPRPGAMSSAQSPQPPSNQARIGSPDIALGRDWQRSADVLVTGVGDDGGFHIYVARERDAFRWTMLATLRLPNWDSGPWTGYPCVTGSGRYAVAVYAPSFAADYYGNEPFIDFINYGLSDCGYGISQVTDGMEFGDNTYNAAQQVAIATDYAANIAAALQAASSPSGPATTSGIPPWWGRWTWTNSAPPTAGTCGSPTPTRRTT